MSGYFKRCLMFGFCAVVLRASFAAAAPQSKSPGATAIKNLGKTADSFSPDLLRPDSQVPLNPEKYVWKLSTKYSTLSKNSNEIPVYTFNSDHGGRAMIGTAKAGEELTLEEFRRSDRRNFYRYQWSGSSSKKGELGRNAAFWIDGLNIECAGKK